MDFRRFWQAVRRFKYIVILCVIIGVGGGIAYTVVSPPLFTGTALVVLPTGAKFNIQTEVLVASSDPVLLEAAETVSPPMSLQLLRQRVQVGDLTADVVSISGKATTASRAEELANSVANSYLAYIKAPSSLGGVLPGRIMEAATTASGSAMRDRAEEGALGGAVGLLIGVVIALSLGRADKRLRQRDDIADADWHPRAGVDSGAAPVGRGRLGTATRGLRAVGRGRLESAQGTALSRTHRCQGH